MTNQVLQANLSPSRSFVFPIFFGSLFPFLVVFFAKVNVLASSKPKVGSHACLGTAYRALGCVSAAADAAVDALVYSAHSYWGFILYSYKKLTELS
jgi:hypothetical protein